MQEFSKARYSGPLSGVSTAGDYGFIDSANVRLEFGHDGPLPKKGVFVHKRSLPYLKQLRDGMGISFQIRDSDRNGGKPYAAECDLEPLFLGTIMKVSKRGDFGFVIPDHIEIDPSQADIFHNTVPTHLFPNEDVFVHVGSFKPNLYRLGDGVRITFRVERVRIGKNAGKLIAYKIGLL